MYIFLDPGLLLGICYWVFYMWHLWRKEQMWQLLWIFSLVILLFLFICILFPSRVGCVLNLLWNAEMNSLPRSENYCFQNICIAFTCYLLTSHALADQNDYGGNAHSVPLLMGLSCILSLLFNLLAFIKTRLPQFSSRN